MERMYCLIYTDKQEYDKMSHNCFIDVVEVDPGLKDENVKVLTAEICKDLPGQPLVRALTQVQYDCWTNKGKRKVTGVGTQMSEEAYEEYILNPQVHAMTDFEAKEVIEKELGFKKELVSIVKEVETFYRDENDEVKLWKVLKRLPMYESPSKNYIRFDVQGWSWECLNGSPAPYIKKDLAGKK